MTSTDRDTPDYDELMSAIQWAATDTVPMRVAEWNTHTAEHYVMIRRLQYLAKILPGLLRPSSSLEGTTVPKQINGHSREALARKCGVYRRQIRQLQRSLESARNAYTVKYDDHIAMARQRDGLQEELRMARGCIRRLEANLVPSSDPTESEKP